MENIESNKDIENNEFENDDLKKDIIEELNGILEEMYED